MFVQGVLRSAELNQPQINEKTNTSKFYLSETSLNEIKINPKPSVDNTLNQFQINFEATPKDTLTQL